MKKTTWIEHLYDDSEDPGGLGGGTKIVMCGMSVWYTGEGQTGDEWTHLSDYLTSSHEWQNARPWCPKCVAAITPLMRLAHTEL